MQFRLTLSEEDAIEARICGEAKPLNVRRRAEYLRRLLVRGYLAEREDIEKLGGFPGQSQSRNASLPRDYNKSNANCISASEASSGSAQLEARSLHGIFADQAAGSNDGNKGEFK